MFHFFRGLQPVPNEEVFKIYEGTHLAITKINPSNFLNVSSNEKLNFSLFWEQLENNNDDK